MKTEHELIFYSQEVLSAIILNDLSKIREILDIITITELESNSSRMNYLCYALEKHRLDILTFLIKKGANPLIKYNVNNRDLNFFEYFFRLTEPIPSYIVGGSTIMYSSNIIVSLKKQYGQPQQVQIKMQKKRPSHRIGDVINLSYEDKIKKSVKSLMIQKKLFKHLSVEQLPEIVIEFNKLKVLHPKLQEKYNYLLTVNDLGLF